MTRRPQSSGGLPRSLWRRRAVSSTPHEALPARRQSAASSGQGLWLLATTVLAAFPPGSDPEPDGERTRRAILHLLHAMPGLTRSEICQSLGRGWGNVYYHLGRLQAAREVKSISWGSRGRHWFPAGIDGQDVLVIRALSDDSDIVAALLATPGAGVGELARSLDADRRLVRRHLTRLEEAGIVEADDDTRRVKYRVTGPARTRLDGLLLDRSSTPEDPLLAPREARSPLHEQETTN